MDFNFGLDQSLIDAVKGIVKVEEACNAKEELVGGQKKIDKNGNGKLDADDFKKLRKEESEDLDESNKFVNVATSKRIVADAEKALNDNPNMFHGAKTGFKRQITIHKKHIENASKNMNEEQLDELSKDTLGSYVKKANVDASNQTGLAAASSPLIAGKERGDTEASNKHFDKANKRIKGISKAVDKLTKEQVEEIEALATKHGLTEE